MELSHVLAYLAESAAISARAEAAAVFLLDDNGAHLNVAAVHKLPVEWLDRAPQEIESCVLDREALTGHAVVAADAQRDPRLVMPGQDFHAELCMPLIHEGDPLGTLHLYATEPDRFCEDDAAALKPLADLGAAAIAATRAWAELQAREVDQAQFVRLTTHELRSPVTVSQSLVRSVLKGYAGELTAKQEEMFSRVSRRLDLLESLINDLLDLASSKVSKSETEGPVVINASVARVMLLLQPRAEDKGLKITFMSCHDQLIVRGTDEGLDRIFVNLLGNAIKYTPSGGVIAISVQQADGQAQVQVSDTGIGVPEESLPHLFEEFYRAPNAKRVEVGTGLGLAIVKDLVDRYGGRIQVKSTVGLGTTFTVTLPLLSTHTV